MIGPKKLSTIRQELKRALAAIDDDPIRWLEERMTTPEGQETAAAGGSEVLQSLRRILEATEKEKRRRPRAGTKK
jgi:hypothetical protein